MLNSGQNVEWSVATKLNRITKVGNQKNKIMQSSKIASILAFTAMVLIATESKAQTIATKNISLEAAKKIVTEAVKYAKANNAPGGRYCCSR